MCKLLDIGCYAGQGANLVASKVTNSFCGLSISLPDSQ